MTDFQLKIDEFPNMGYMTTEQEFDQAAFGASGENISPTLHWTNAPADTQSFAITVYDPDAPTGSGFWHWILVNIPANVHNLPKNAGQAHSSELPKGAIQVANDFGLIGFSGAAPPKGDKAHRYIFKVHALKVKHLPINEQTSNAIARFMIHLNEIAHAEYTGLYQIR